MLIDQSIEHFGTLPHFVRHYYGIRHSGMNPPVHGRGGAAEQHPIFSSVYRQMTEKAFTAQQEDLYALH